MWGGDECRDFPYASELVLRLTGRHQHYSPCTISVNVSEGNMVNSVLVLWCKQF